MRPNKYRQWWRRGGLNLVDTKKSIHEKGGLDFGIVPVNEKFLSPCTIKTICISLDDWLWNPEPLISWIKLESLGCSDSVQQQPV